MNFYARLQKPDHLESLFWALIRPINCQSNSVRQRQVEAVRYYHILLTDMDANVWVQYLIWGNLYLQLPSRLWRWISTITQQGHTISIRNSSVLWPARTIPLPSLPNNHMSTQKITAAYWIPQEQHPLNCKTQLRRARAALPTQTRTWSNHRSFRDVAGRI